MSKLPADDRDQTQRSLGFIGLSAFAHLGLLIAVLLAPSFKSVVGKPEGTKPGLEFTGELVADASPAPAKTSEVLLADPSDASAVALPAAAPVKAAAANTSAVKTPATKTPKVESADIDDALKTARKQAAETKAAMPAAKPAPKAAPVETQKASDVAVDEAVPLEIALPEKESLTEAQAEALQAPNAIPADAEPIETVSAVRSNDTASGLVVTKPANAPAASQAVVAGGAGAGGSGNGTTSGATRAASTGGNQGYGVPAGATVRDARSLIATEKPQATYPLQDRIGHHEGTTILLGHVTNDGRVERIQLEQSSGSRLMDESAAKAFSQWKFKPGQEGYIRLPIQFQLAGADQIIPAQLNRQ